MSPSERALREALAELVACKDMRLRLVSLDERGHGTDYQDLWRLEESAWEAARRALANEPAPAPVAMTDASLREALQAIADGPPPNYITKLVHEVDWRIFGKFAQNAARQALACHPSLVHPTETPTPADIAKIQRAVWESSKGDFDMTDAEATAAWCAATGNPYLSPDAGFPFPIPRSDK